MKRILVLNYEFPPLGGGASPVSYELAKRLSETGEYDIDVVTMHYKGLPKFEEINTNFRVHRVACLRSKKEICYPWEQLTYLIAAYFKCCQLIKKQAFDVCHAHFIIPTGVLALKLKNKFSLDYVISSHGSDVLGYNKRFQKLYPYLVGSWRKVLEHAKIVTSPSNFLKEKILIEFPGFDSSKIVVIPNGIDTEKFKPGKKKDYILSSGRLHEAKGFQHLINAVSRADVGWDIHIVGDGPMRPILEEMAGQSKTRIIFHGWLDSDKIDYKKLMSEASVYVSLSEYESFGLTVLEAMSSGCLVIANNVPGLNETISDSGITVDAGSGRDVFEVLRMVINSSGLRKTLQTKALNRSFTYDWSFVIDQYTKLI